MKTILDGLFFVLFMTCGAFVVVAALGALAPLLEGTAAHPWLVPPSEQVLAEFPPEVAREIRSAEPLAWWEMPVFAAGFVAVVGGSIEFLVFGLWALIGMLRRGRSRWLSRDEQDLASESDWEWLASRAAENERGHGGTREAPRAAEEAATEQSRSPPAPRTSPNREVLPPGSRPPTLH
jgi:hypothetical protein